MYRDSRRLVDHREIIIFVENVERNRFGGDFELFGLRNFDLHLLAGLNSMRWLSDHAVDAHAPFGDQFLNSRAAEFARARGEKAVEPSPGIIFAHSERQIFSRIILLVANVSHFRNASA